MPSCIGKLATGASGARGSSGSDAVADSIEQLLDQPAPGLAVQKIDRALAAQRGARPPSYAWALVLLPNVSSASNRIDATRRARSGFGATQHLVAICCLTTMC